MKTKGIGVNYILFIFRTISLNTIITFSHVFFPKNITQLTLIQTVSPTQSLCPLCTLTLFTGYQLKQHKTHFWGYTKCCLGGTGILALLTVVCCNLFILFAFSLSLPTLPLSFYLSFPLFICLFCVFLLFLLFTLRRINESSLLMCSRISSLDYTCNLHPVSSGFVLLFLFLSRSLLPAVFLFGLHFMISHCVLSVQLPCQTHQGPCLSFIWPFVLAGTHCKQKLISRRLRFAVV